jgi:NAD(P)-dependent dehydrogenase (short-subunit alcohol dehydrogenase family)
MVDYASTKGAIVGFTRSAALQLIPKGIRVNAVAYAFTLNILLHIFAFLSLVLTVM